MVAHATLSLPQPNRPLRRRDAEFPLRGFVRCETCGRLLTGSWSKGRNSYYAYSTASDCAGRFYRRPLAAFYLRGHPAAEEPVHDFRRIHGQAVGRSSPDLLLAIRRCRERREIALDLCHQLDAALNSTVTTRQLPAHAA